MARRRFLAVFVAAACVAGCSGPTPEERLRAMLHDAELAVEAGNLAGVRARVAEDYLDEAGRDKRTVIQLLALQRAGTGSAHLWTTIRSLDLDRSGGATVRLLVAVAGIPIEGLDDLAGIDADLLRVDLVCRDDPDAGWQVTSASWRRADLSEPGG